MNTSVQTAISQKTGTWTEDYNELKKSANTKIDISEILIDEKDSAEKYESFVNPYKYEREHGRINGLTPSEMFLQRLIKSI